MRRPIALVLLGSLLLVSCATTPAQRQRALAPQPDPCQAAAAGTAAEQGYVLGQRVGHSVDVLRAARNGAFWGVFAGAVIGDRLGGNVAAGAVAGALAGAFIGGRWGHKTSQWERNAAAAGAVIGGAAGGSARCPEPATETAAPKQ